MTTEQTERHDWLEPMLACQEHIPDGGFSDRVMRALPPPRPLRARTPILLASTLLACLVGFVAFPGHEYLLQAAREVLEMRPWAGTLPIASLGVIALVVWGAVAAVRAES